MFNIVWEIPIDKVRISVGYNSLLSACNTGRVVTDLVTMGNTIVIKGIQPAFFNVWEFGLISWRYVYVPKTL